MAKIGYIIRSYPRLSQTFITNEIAALEQLGLNLHLFPITNPHEPIVQEQVASIRAPVDYLEAAASRSWRDTVADHLLAAVAAPLRYIKALRYVRQRADLDQDYHVDTRYGCFAQALYLARLLRRERRTGQPITHLHAHFAHDPTLIALLVHMLTGIPYSFTAHARDLVQIGQRALIERIAQANVVLTCSNTNIDYINEVVPAPLRHKIQLIHHGVNIEGFQPGAVGSRQSAVGSRQSAVGSRQSAVGSRQSTVGSRTSSPRRLVTSSHLASRLPPPASSTVPPLILSVGRLVEKKGLPDLLYACAQLKRMGYRFHCAIYGEGPLSDELAALIARLELTDEVALAGACSQQELLPIFQRASIFALAPFVTADGDRDGIPNVLVEAMACGLPVVSTDVAGIPELVRHNQNGLLVAPHDIDGLARALGALLDDPTQRERLGAAARQIVVEYFDLRGAARQIAALFGYPVVAAEPLAQHEGAGYGPDHRLGALGN